MTRPALLALLAIPLLAGPALAQGSAPAQGVTAPQPPPTPQVDPPVPPAASLTDGRPRVDRGDGPQPTDTSPSTTANTPVPDHANAGPPPAPGQPPAR